MYYFIMYAMLVAAELILIIITWAYSIVLCIIIFTGFSIYYLLRKLNLI